MPCRRARLELEGGQVVVFAFERRRAGRLFFIRIGRTGFGIDRPIDDVAAFRSVCQAVPGFCSITDSSSDESLHGIAGSQVEVGTQGRAHNGS